MPVDRRAREADRVTAQPRWQRLLRADAPAATLLVRVAVGVVFAAEGIQKFLYPDALGAGRFARIGIPAPEVMGPFIGVLEIACGVLVLAGLLTRLAAAPLVADMIGAITSTKLPILLGHGVLGFAGPTAAAGHGLWSMLHEARTDLSMLLCAGFLVLAGAGPRSLDAVLLRRGATRPR